MLEISKSRSCFAGVVGTLLLFVVDTANADQQTNTDYIDGLQYDLKQLLSVSLSPSSQPAVDPRTERNGAVIICSKTPNTARSDATENALLDPSGGVIFPGALVQEDRSLAEGLPTPLTLPRAPLRIRVDLPGIGASGSRTIDNPSNLSVPAAIDEIVDTWFTTTAEKQGYKPAIRAFFSANRAYTTEQIGVDMGFSAQWGNNSASAKIDLSHSTEQTVVMKAFKQVYFTTIVEEPGTAGSVFLDDVVLTPRTINAEQPPGFVRSVDYGRIIVVQMITKGAESSIDAQAALDYATGTDVTVKADLKTKYKNIVDNSQFKVLALGGSAADSVELFSGSPDKILGVIAAGVTFSKDNPAYPIAYKVADLKTRQVAKMSVTTDYIETNCQEYPNGWVELSHKGGYVAYFTMNWKERDKLGNLVSKNWSSGDKTAGYSHKIWLPGDATDIRIKGVEYTGLLWDKERDALNLRLPAVPNKCYAIWGTTLDPRGGGC
jgi:thiol-activated cytolysin